MLPGSFELETVRDLSVAHTTLPTRHHICCVTFGCKDVLTTMLKIHFCGLPRLERPLRRLASTLFLPTWPNDMPFRRKDCRASFGDVGAIRNPLNILALALRQTILKPFKLPRRQRERQTDRQRVNGSLFPPGGL